MSRNSITLKKGWKFIHEDFKNACQVDFDDSSWQDVCVPHDWAIAGPFDELNDCQVQSVVADGIRQPVRMPGRTGSLPHTGVGWYRTKFTTTEKFKKYYLEFDGAMSNSEIYVNGVKIGGCHYGYTSFTLEITNVIDLKHENTLAVKLSPQECSSRWYPGAGLYREVRLLCVDSVHVAYNGTYVTTLVAGDKITADVNIETTVDNIIDNVHDYYRIRQTIYNCDGKQLNCTGQFCKSKNIQKVTISNPHLWSIDRPYLYTLVTELRKDGEIVDSYTTKFGIRHIDFDKDKGFFLNSEHVKLKGVCMHHDMGAIGTAVNKSAIRRQVEMLKDMGCNSIRTSHNPPAPELLDLCDELGLVVLDEAFDEWRLAKVDNGYHNYFDKDCEKDLTTMIKRDRNHPCIIMWSIGNEIIDQHSKDGKYTARMLTNICHKVDPTRPTTAGFNNPDAAIPNGLCDEVDIVGFNYKPHRYNEYHKDHPNWIIYGSETESCVSTRGEYTFPVELKYPAEPTENKLLSSFDVLGPVWAYSPEKEFAAQDDCEFILGEYVWTGFDYLGEPCPFRDHYPSRSAYFGIIDLAGIPKDRFYSYQAKWSNKDVLHIFPHWNWKEENREEVEVHCYSNCKQVELFVNGKSMGVMKNDKNDLLRRYRFIWQNVKFEEGYIKAIGMDENGNEILTETVYTASKPVAIKLIPEKTEISCDGEQLCYTRVQVVDEKGVVCPWAMNIIDFTVSGNGVYVASDNGKETSTRVFSESYCDVFYGQAIVITKGNETAGEMTITATSDGLTTGTATIKTL